MSFETLKEQVFLANLFLVQHGLVQLTWGNASGIDREQNIIAIKPSGVPYQTMQAKDMVLLDLESGLVRDSALKPSSDTATHLELYRAFPEIGAVVHTHSRYATAWAQTGLDLPCFGTTHADYFYGAIPCMPPLGDAEIAQNYEQQTGLAIVRTFAEKNLSPTAMPGVLLAGHALFCWGKNTQEAVQNALVLELVAEMAATTIRVNPDAQPISQTLLEKHYLRKHGERAYYGQS